MNALGIIPARLGSTRLKEKVLQLIDGKPMIVRVFERAQQAVALDQVIVACDDERIRQCVVDHGGEAVLTRPDHPNGSSRVAEAAALYDATIVVNIQGDEPLICPGNIDKLVGLLNENPAVPAATLAVRRTDRAGYENSHVVKIACDRGGRALYFSRSPIPFFREPVATQFSYLKHLGIYAFRKNILMEFAAWGVTPLEEIEKLEQLRLLEHGLTLRVIETEHDSQGVDTADDLQRVEAVIKAELPKK